jgi:hypothetical protein
VRPALNRTSELPVYVKQLKWKSIADQISLSDELDVDEPWPPWFFNPGLIKSVRTHDLTNSYYTTHIAAERVVRELVAGNP